MRKQLTPQQKAQIVLELLKEEKTIAQIASEYEIHPTQLNQWKKAALDGLPQLFERRNKKTDKAEKEQQKKIDELYHEIGYLTTQVKWLKKNLASLKTKQERRGLVEFKNPKISVVKQAELLCINRSTVYYKQKPPTVDELDLKTRINDIYLANPTYGSRRITAILRRIGLKVNRKAVRRHMKELGLVAIHPGPNLSRRNLKNYIYPYLLRDVTASYPNHIWGIDITYIRLGNSWMYLVAVIDWFSRYIVEWELSQTLNIEFVLETVTRALRTGKPVIMNSDQGSHFTSPKYIEILKTANVQISMDGKKRALDNVFTERFWRSIKWEEIYLTDYRSPREVRVSVTNYMKKYNFERPHQSLNYSVPAELYFDTTIKVA